MRVVFFVVNFKLASFKTEVTCPSVKVTCPLLTAPFKKLHTPQRSFLPGKVKLAKNRGGSAKAKPLLRGGGAGGFLISIIL